MTHTFRRLAPLFVLAAAASAQATIVLSNNPAPGDAFNNTGATNQGQAVGASGWYYNNVRRDGTSGISTAYARSGNGSARLQGTQDPSKADIEFLGGGFNLAGNYVATTSLGSFGRFTGMSYDWYRAGSSTARPDLHPVIRVLLDADGNLATTGDRGGLVFERVYNTPSAIATDTWVSDTVTTATNLWNFGLGLGFAFNINATGYAYDANLAEWQAFLPNAAVLGFSLGIGSGWGGTFDGAVDNVTFMFGDQSSTFNFEVASEPVPEPFTLALGAAGLAAAVRRRRARG